MQNSVSWLHVTEAPFKGSITGAISCARILPAAIIWRKEIKWWRTAGVSSSAKPKSKSMSCSCPLTVSAATFVFNSPPSVLLTKMLPGWRSLQVRTSLFWWPGLWWLGLISKFKISGGQRCAKRIRERLPEELCCSRVYKIVSQQHLEVCIHSQSNHLSIEGGWIPDVLCYTLTCSSEQLQIAPDLLLDRCESSALDICNLIFNRNFVFIWHWFHNPALPTIPGFGANLVQMFQWGLHLRCSRAVERVG